MKPAQIFNAIIYPLTQSSVIVPVIVLWLLMSFARWGGVLGLFLMVGGTVMAASSKFGLPGGVAGLAIEATTASGNIELATVLKGY